MYSIIYLFFFIGFLSREGLTTQAGKNTDSSYEVNTLPEIILGDSNAPLTIIMYFSPTCSHCADYETRILPVIQEKYITKGKVRLIVRILPFYEIDFLAARLIWCRGIKFAFENIKLLLTGQKEWLTPATFKSKKRQNHYKKLISDAAEKSNISPENLEKILDLQVNKEDSFLKLFALINGFDIQEVRSISFPNLEVDQSSAFNHISAAKIYGKNLSSVPSFVLNGKPKEGWVEPKDIEELISETSE